jgi:nucleotidyltransferase substrate binding protein (TIGR01987 family)
MMESTDIRWYQRLDNYTRALKQLRLVGELASTRALSELEKQGLIQIFKFTHELAWNVMKDYFFFQGSSDITGSRDATRAAYSKGLIQDGEGWMEMIKSRNQTSHTYNQRVADEIVQLIIKIYAPCFELFLEKMQALKANG